jgi:hypothetical protein
MLISAGYSVIPTQNLVTDASGGIIQVKRISNFISLLDFYHSDDN